MNVRLTKAQTGTAGPLAVGAEIEHADAYRLIQLGVAEPIDDEAKAKMAEIEVQQKANAERVGRMRQEIAAARRAELVAKHGPGAPQNRKLDTK